MSEIMVVSGREEMVAALVEVSNGLAVQEIRLEGTNFRFTVNANADVKPPWWYKARPASREDRLRKISNRVRRSAKKLWA